MKLLLLFILIISFQSYSQIDFQDHLITASYENSTSVYASDIDGDGDLDMISSSSDDSSVIWFKNTDGLGTFSLQQVLIATTSKFVFSEDIDSDGDMDIISNSGDDLVWFENTDGLGTFGTEQIIFTESPLLFFVSVNTIDIDGDGDIDIVLASRDSASDNKITWFENTDGLGTFGTEQIITTEASGLRAIYSIDIDNDGDMDVLSASFIDSKIAWYKNNDGLGSFGPQQVISTDVIGAKTVYANDIDGDGDMDVISASLINSTIAWHENLDGLGNFGVAQILTTTSTGTSSVSAKDIDNDGDIDIISAFLFDDKISWHENTDGLGTFGTELNISTGVASPISIYVADFDGDGNMDVASASLSDFSVSWHENLNILALNDNILTDFYLYPIPTKNIVTITSKSKIVQLDVYNQLGQLVLQNKNLNYIDLSNLKSGLYFIKIKDVNGALGVKKIIKTLF